MSEGRFQLYVQRLDSTAPLQVTQPPLAGPPFPLWAPDSRELYFTAGAPGARALWKVSAIGGEPALVQPDTNRAAISPDGRTLALLRVTRSPTSVAVWIASPPDAPPRLYEPPPFQDPALVASEASPQTDEAWAGGTFIPAPVVIPSAARDLLATPRAAAMGVKADPSLRSG